MNVEQIQKSINRLREKRLLIKISEHKRRQNAPVGQIDLLGHLKTSGMLVDETDIPGGDDTTIKKEES